MSLPHGSDAGAPASAALPPPRLSQPFPTEIHDQVEELERRCMDWTLRFGLISDADSVQRLARSRIGLMAAAAYPYGALDKVELAGQWLVWGFAFDDRFIDSAEGTADAVEAATRIPTYQHIVDHPDDGIDPGDPYAVGLRDICLRLADTATADQVERFSNGMAAFLLGTACKSALRARHVVPPLAQYRAQRRLDVGLCVMFPFIDYAGEFELPAGALHDQRIRSLHTHVSLAVAYANDIYSHRKEGDGEFNLPLVLARAEGRSSTAVDLYEAEIAAILDLSEQSRVEDPGHPIERYVAGLQLWVSGHDLWSRTTGRYRDGAEEVAWS